MLKPIPLARYAFLFCQALLLLSCSNKASSVAGGAGFKEAIFDEAMLNTVMNDPQCVTVRFYNVRRTASDNKGTALAIGVRSDGTEIYNGTSAKYRMSDKISGGSVIYIDLLKPAAI
ncbi:MAG: hypothetical protein KDB84_05040, partial [Flavobacteriales bacterium]|nr:hypothetical protein [Flavobacteriales bacterium]